MDGGFGFMIVLFVLLGFVIPIAVMGNQRARRTPVDYGGGVAYSSSVGGPAPGPSGGSSGPRVSGRPLKCGHCSGIDFEEREAQLNTAMATFFNFDWANRTATCFVCRRCGHIEWFLL